MDSSDRPGWRRPRSYHHGNLKEVLLEAARKLIEEHGAFGFSLTEAARLAGVSPAAPYRHFRDRDALLAEVFPDVPLSRPVGPHETLLSIDKARRLLGYEPRHSWRDTGRRS